MSILRGTDPAESNSAAAAICQAARRLDAGVICIGKRRRSHSAAAQLGSVSADVLARVERPVLLARAPRA